MDFYQQQLQQEIARNSSYNQIKAQYDIYSKQATTMSAGNAVANLGVLLTSAPKATSAISAIHNIVWTPYRIGQSLKDMTTRATNPMSATDLQGMPDRVMGLVKDLRANPEIRVALQNYTTNSASTNGGLGRFITDYNEITGKSVDFISPHEISLATKLDKVASNYDNFIRTNRGLTGVDAEGEVNAMTARLGDMLKARTNQAIVRSRYTGVGNDARLTADNVASRNTAQLEDLGTDLDALEPAVQRSITNFASAVRPNLQGYRQLETEPALESDESLSRAMSSADLNEAEHTSLLAGEFEPAEFVSSAVSRLPPATTSMPPTIETTGTAGTIDAPTAVATTSTAPTAGAGVAETTTTATTAPVAAETAAETAPTAVAETAAVSTASEAAAGAAGAGILSGFGDLLSLATGPVGALVGLGGLGYSIYQAMTGAEQKAPAPDAPPPAPTFNPLTSVAPASSLHF